MVKKNFKSFSNLAITLDGKIADPALPSKMLGTPYDKRMMKRIRSEADVVVFGASTLKASKKPIKSIVNAVISASGKLPKTIAFWKDPKVIRFVFTTQTGFKNAVESSGGRAFVVIAGKDRIDPKLVFKRLLESGLDRILVEGGGETLALFLGARLIQEMFVTLTPRIIGGRSSPTLVGGESVLSPWPNLRIKSLKKVKNEIYFCYQVLGSKTSV